MKKLTLLLIIISIVFSINIYAADDGDESSSVISEVLKRRLEEEKLMEKKEDPDALVNMGDEYFEKTAYEKARDSYQKAFDLAPQFPGIKLKVYKAQIMYLLEKYRLVFYIVGVIGILMLLLRIYSYFLSGAPQRAENQKAKKLKALKDDFIAGKYDDTIKIANELQKSNYAFSIPDKFSIHSLLAKSYYKKGVFNNAKIHAVEALKLRSVAPDLHDLLTDIFLKMKDHSPRAIKEYEIALKKRPNDTKIINLLFDYYYAKKEISDQAINIYNKVFKYQPENLQALDMICLRGIRKKDVSASVIAIYERVLKELRPDDTKLKQLLLKAYYNNKRFKELIPIAKELLLKGGFVEDKEMHKFLFDAFKAERKLDDIEAFYSQLKEKYPESAVLQQIMDEHTGRKEDVNIENNLSGDFASKGIKICPICAHINLKDADFCEKCKKPLNL